MTKTLSLLGGLLSLSLPLQAQESTATSNEVFDLSPFEVGATEGYVATNSVSGTKFAASLYDTPLTINVLTRQFLDDLNMDTLTQSLQFTAGVSVQDGYNATGGRGINGENRFVMRGNTVRFIYRDGVRTWRGDEPYFIDRIEVLKGPTAILFGQALPGGTLNYISKKPIMGSTGGEVSIGMDSYGLAEGKLDFYGNASENMGFRVAAVMRDGDTYADNEERSQINLMASLLYQPFEKTRISFNVQKNENTVDNVLSNGNILWRGADNKGAPSRGGSAGGSIGLHPNADIGTNPFSDNYWGSFIEIYSETFAIQLEHELADNLDLRVSYTSTDAGHDTFRNFFTQVNTEGFGKVLAPDGTEILGAAGDTILIGSNSFVVANADTMDANTISGATAGVWRDGSLRPAVYRTDAGTGSLRAFANDFSSPNLFNPNRVPGWFDQQNFENQDHMLQAELTYAFETDETSHRILIGAEQQRGWFLQRNVDQSLSNWPQEFPVYDIVLDQSVDIYGRPIQESPLPIDGIFQQYSRGFSTNSSGFDALYAVYTGSYFSDKLNLLAGIRTEDAFADTTEYSETTPQAGAIFEVTDGLAIYASYSESFNLNNRRFTGRPQSAGPPNAYEPNGLFPPEYGTGIDFGIKFQLMEERLTGNLTYFQIEHENIPVPHPTVRENRGRPVNFPDGVNDTKGVELEVFYTASDQLQLTGGLTWIDAIYKEAGLNTGLVGTPLQNSSEWQATFFARYSVSDSLILGGGFAYSSEPAPPFDLPADFSWGSRTVVNVFARYSIELFNGQEAIIGININNLFDEEYYTNIAQANPGINAKLNITLPF
jgi:outer membrane receptor protein involved in Fe transport